MKCVHAIPLILKPLCSQKCLTSACYPCATFLTRTASRLLVTKLFSLTHCSALLEMINSKPSCLHIIQNGFRLHPSRCRHLPHHTRRKKRFMSPRAAGVGNQKGYLTSEPFTDGLQLLAWSPFTSLSYFLHQGWTEPFSPNPEVHIISTSPDHKWLHLLMTILTDSFYSVFCTRASLLCFYWLEN